jgi:hypothetical protein
MSRLYTPLECGCLISCDGGGGLIPCDNPDCKAREYMDEHQACKHCGECKVCYPDHCMAGSIDHHCDAWDAFINEYIGMVWFQYCPWCGEKLEY